METIVIVIISLMTLLFSCVFLWQLFIKEGEKGWIALIPIYNIFKLLQIVEIPVWLIILIFIVSGFFLVLYPIIMIIILIKYHIKNYGSPARNLIITYLVTFFLFITYQTFAIVSGSMTPTLNIGDRFMVNKFLYGYHIPIVDIKLPALTSPKRADLVVFIYPKYQSPELPYKILNYIDSDMFFPNSSANNPKLFVKRVIGLPGDTLKSKEKCFIINGQSLPHSRMISNEYNDTILSINNPYHKLSHNYTDIPENESYYNKEQSGQMKGADGELLFTEQTDNKEYIIQIQHPDLPIGVYPFLYIPKKDDIIELKLSENKNNIIFKVNGNQMGVIDLKDFEEYMLRYYGSLIPTTSNNLITEIQDKSMLINVDADYYFLVGDNRDNSHDSRMYGLVHQKLIYGSFTDVYWPIKRIGVKIK